MGGIMSEKRKFHRMTRPIKFRRSQVFFKSVGHSYEVGVDKCKYLFNYILYKLNILKRYTNRTHENIWRPTINGVVSEVYERSIRSKHFTGVLQSVLVEELEANVDYFYYTDRKGLKHITYTVDNWEKHLYKVKTSLIKPGLIIDGKVYNYESTPKIMTVFKRPDILPFDGCSSVTLKPQTIQYDLTKLLRLAHESAYLAELEMSYVTIQQALFKAQQEFQKYLDTLTLKDIEV